MSIRTSDLPPTQSRKRGIDSKTAARHDAPPMSFHAPDPNPCDLIEPAADALDAIEECDQRLSPVSVFCIDDHAGFREVVRDLIGATSDFVLVGEASSGAAAIALVPELSPDLVLIDVHMPGMSGFEAATRLGGDQANPLIVLMSARPIELPPGLALRGGAPDFVTKQELSARRLRDLWHRRRPL
jgi:CheY-like chemotaxis protein